MENVKFKAWIKELNIFLFDLSIYPKRDYNMIGIGLDELESYLPENYSIQDDYIVEEIEGKYHKRREILHGEDWIFFADVKILMFTGVKDKNNEDIYEGDKVVSNGYPRRVELIVKFIDGAFCIGNEGLGRNKGMDNYATIRDIMFMARNKGKELELEIVGNIFDK